MDPLTEGLDVNAVHLTPSRTFFQKEICFIKNYDVTDLTRASSKLRYMRARVKTRGALAPYTAMDPLPEGLDVNAVHLTPGDIFFSK
jgi:hypothetical protein